MRYPDDTRIPGTPGSLRTERRRSVHARVPTQYRPGDATRRDRRPGGVTFRTWAPAAREVYIALSSRPAALRRLFPRTPDDLLVKDANGFWTGFVPGMGTATSIASTWSAPAARASSAIPTRASWSSTGIRTATASCAIRRLPLARCRLPPAGVQRPDRLPVSHRRLLREGRRRARTSARIRVCKILDVVDRIEYLADLGVNAVMPLPFQEYQGENSLGYNGTDLFSPEMDYAVRPRTSRRICDRVNRLLTAEGTSAARRGQLTGQINQFKAFIDLCHLYGIAVIADVVYNHAGGGFDDQSIWFFDRQPEHDRQQQPLLHRRGSRRRACLRVLETGGAPIPDRQRQVAAAGVPCRRAALRPGDGDRRERRLVLSPRTSPTPCASSSRARSRSPNTGATSAGRGTASTSRNGLRHRLQRHAARHDCAR